uniref:Ribophorin II n=1 Tax=Compsopogon caeruleus TaxID=31354 RepID=A0A7S1XAV6_9RHOD
MGGNLVSAVRFKEGGKGDWTRLEVMAGASEWDPVEQAIEMTEKHVPSLELELTDVESPPPRQMFVRFTKNDKLIRYPQGKREVVYLGNLKGSGPSSRVSFELTVHPKDLDFWDSKGKYQMELVVGDPRMKSPRVMVWTLCNEVIFDYINVPASKRKPPVFDFDVSIKKSLQPEFIFEPSPVERRAPRLFSLLWAALTLAPLLALIRMWSRLGAFPLDLPTSSLPFLGFQFCLVLNALLLVSFWLGWTIIATTKYLLILAIPTILFGHQALSQLPSQLPMGKDKGE